jgi:Class II Aldolase and Adducin N-terminal domain
MSEEIRALVATASRILAAAGQGDLIWGHASARDPDGHGVWLKPAGWGLEEVTPERVHLVSEDGQVLEGDGSRHSEYPIHTEVMIARPDVGGVVHTHPPHAVALAATGQPLRPVSHAANYFVPPDVPRFTGTGDLILTRTSAGRSRPGWVPRPRYSWSITASSPWALIFRPPRSPRSCWNGPARSRCSPTPSAGGPAGPGRGSRGPSGAKSTPTARSGLSGSTWSAPSARRRLDIRLT